MMKNTIPAENSFFSKIEPPYIMTKSKEIDWHDTADILIVGLGGAGVACALQALELGQSVIALDRYAGGGATTASGGVIYAGGGTALQKEAHIEDSPENMYAYLKQETDQIVTPGTLRDFCQQSASTIDWMAQHGVKFCSTVWSHKTSYPAPQYFLYHSDNSLLKHYQKEAYPAARGHRGYVPIKQGRKATGLGGALFNPLLSSARKQGLKCHTYSEVRQLICDKAGCVIGVKAYQFQTAHTRRAYQKTRAKADRLLKFFPPSVPGSKFFMRRALKLLEKSRGLETQRQVLYLRARKGVLLSAGGFIFNRKMLTHYAPKYQYSFPLGTDGDNGAGIELGQSVGGAIDNMNRITAWRFINPPLAFARGMIVNQQSQRFINEMVYGATLGVEIVENHDGQAWLILDKALVRQALFEVRGKKALNFQKILARLNIYFGAKKAASIEALAQKTGLDPQKLHQQWQSYRTCAQGSKKDPFGKSRDDMAELDTAPFYAINVGLNARLLPCPSLTLGGLVINETSGQVMNTQNQPIKGLYAAGRNAIGIASWNYVSGLSIADGIYSGRRVACSLAAHTLA